MDLCRNPQTEIDLLRTAIVKNAMAGATPRYFVRSDGGINEQELLDISKPLVHISGNLGEDSIRAMEYTALQGNYISVLQETVQELRETSGNTETATGSAPGGGITAASAIAALQEASGKGSRDATLASYRAYTGIVGLVIELIRQFYDMPRQFRILGEQGGEEYVTYTNAGLKPQPQGMAFGEDMGFRLPVFDIKVSAQKKSAYTKMSQNELALQFYQLGFFSPDAVDQTMLCLEMMDFDGKDGMMQRVAQQGTLRDKLGQYMQLALTLAAKAAPEMVQGLSEDILQTMGGGAVIPQGQVAAQQQPEAEHPYVQQAREQSRAAAEPEEGPVMV